jgi:N-acetylmuramoyl-L-alanine amidase
MVGRRRLLAASCAGLALAACTTFPQDPSRGPPRIDTRHSSLNHESRVRYLILHYTQLDLQSSLDALTRGPVSSHYLVTDGNPPVSYRLVAEDRRAWHAGQSHWRGDTALNSSSIGIEIVNLGPGTDAASGFQPYPEAQIDEVIRLVRDVVRRHGIAAHRILGHSDVAPQRKVDPGPRFPWRRLFEAGLIPWPDEALVDTLLPSFRAALPDVAWFQARLAEHGFEVPRHGTLDADTRRVIVNFQMKYRPGNHDGAPDAETAALLEALTRPGGRVIRQSDGTLARYEPRHGAAR